MTTNTLTNSYSPAILSTIPLFYVGWSDSVLTPSEIEFIRNTIDQLPHVSDDEKKVLNRWCNPKNPPSGALLKQWLKLLQDYARMIPNSKRMGMAQLGIEMAKLQSGKDVLNGVPLSETLEALDSLSSLMGMPSSDTYRRIFENTNWKENINHDFDPIELSSYLHNTTALDRKKILTILCDPAFGREKIPIKSQHREKVNTWLRLLANQGLGQLHKRGGNTSPEIMTRYVLCLELLALHDLSLAIKFGVQFGLFGGSILGLGTEYHHQKFLRKAETLELPGCFAMTETGHGSNVRGLETTLTYDQDTEEIIVHSPSYAAGKEYIGNALLGRMATVFGQLIIGDKNVGIHAVLVPIRDDKDHLKSGVFVEDNGYKLGLNGVDNGRIWFDQVRVPRQNLLNKYGTIDKNGIYSSSIKHAGKRFFVMLGTLVGGRVAIPRAALMAAKKSLYIAIKHGLKRRQFSEHPGEEEMLILDYPSHQRRLMPYLAKSYALHFALDKLLNSFIEALGGNMREVETAAAGLKSYATWFATECIQECREACGGKGYLSENEIGDLKVDTDIFTTFEGDNTVLMQLVAKSLLTNLQKSFHDEGYRAVLRFLSSRIVDTISINNPIERRNTDPDHLTGSEFIIGTFEFRKRNLLNSTSQRMRRLIKRGISPFDAFLRCQNQLLALAEAHIELEVITTFRDSLKQVKDKGFSDSLQHLFILYGLSTIESHKGWYLEQDYISGVKSKAIRRMVDKKCARVRQDAATLIEAFDIPKKLIIAPIAK